MKPITINLLGAEARPSALGLPAGVDVDYVLVGIAALGLIVSLGLPPLVTGAIDTFLGNPADQQIASLQADIKRHKSGTLALRRLQTEVAAREHDLQELQGLVGHGGLWANVLEELRDITPTDLWFTHLQSIDAGNLQLEGAALDYKDIAYLYTNLQNAHNFAAPVLGTISSSQGNDGAPVVQFTLKTALIRPDSE